MWRQRLITALSSTTPRHRLSIAFIGTAIFVNYPFNGELVTIANLFAYMALLQAVAILLVLCGAIITVTAYTREIKRVLDYTLAGALTCAMGTFLPIVGYGAIHVYIIVLTLVASVLLYYTTDFFTHPKEEEEEEEEG